MQMNMVSALNNALEIILRENSDAVLLGEDIGKDGGVFRVTDGLQAKFGDDRVMDTPLAESAIIGSSIGMALAGMHPIPEIQFAGFMYEAFAQLASHASRYRLRTRSTMKVPMVVRTPVSGGIRALEHHSESPEALYSHLGGLIVVEPSGPYDAKGLLIKASRMQDPVIFLEPTKLYRLFKEEVPDGAYEVPIGKANVVKQGSALTIVSLGTMMPLVKGVVAAKGTDAELIDLRTINPLDDATIIESVKKTGKLLIVHEAELSFGIGGEIAARVAEKAIYDLQAPIIRVGSPSLPYPNPGYEKYYVPTEKKVAAAIDKIMSS
jgi:pyruvate/2-oxoglutarate/acetoin dehydrogenase E1 component